MECEAHRKKESTPVARGPYTMRAHSHKSSTEESFDFMRRFFLCDFPPNVVRIELVDTILCCTLLDASRGTSRITEVLWIFLHSHLKWRIIRGACCAQPKFYCHRRQQKQWDTKKRQSKNRMCVWEFLHVGNGCHFQSKPLFVVIFLVPCPIRKMTTLIVVARKPWQKHQ